MQDLIDQMNDIRRQIEELQRLSSSTSEISVISESPSGTINGSNTNFTLARSPIAGTLRLFVNGVRQKPTTDYSISGSTIIMVTPPIAGDILLADYGNERLSITADSGWIEPTLQNAWENYNTSTHEVTAYRKDYFGFVHIKGLVKNGTSGAIFTLPAGFRPSRKFIITASSNSSWCRLDVQTDGVVLASAGYSNLYVSLSNIIYEAA